MIDELLDIRARRDTIRDLVIEALARTDGVNPEIRMLLSADRDLTGDLTKALTRAVEKARATLPPPHLQESHAHANP